MNDNKQQQNQQPVQENTIVEFPKVQGSSSQTPNPQQVTPAPVQQQGQNTAIHKELEPLPSLSTVSEVLTPVENKLELEPEVEAAGVEVVQEAPEVAQEGPIDLAKESVPVAPPAPEVPQKQYPISQENVTKMTKGYFIFKDATNPMLWLALLILRQFQMLAKQKSVQNK